MCMYMDACYRACRAMFFTDARSQIDTQHWWRSKQCAEPVQEPRTQALAAGTHGLGMQVFTHQAPQQQYQATLPKLDVRPAAGLTSRQAANFQDA
jgi:hypothetical protein